MLEFYRQKRVLVTGHSGFQGAWLCQLLLEAGAKVYGYSLPAAPGKSLYQLCGLEEQVEAFYGDICNLPSLHLAFSCSQPEIVFHLAQQRNGTRPAETFETNVMGSVHLLECARQCGSVKSVVLVTSDRVYQDKKWDWPYREMDALGGGDAYSASVACAELAAACYRDAYLTAPQVAVSTARFGPPIGGGDFSKNRILPNWIRAAHAGHRLLLHSPDRIQPCQHVLDPLYGCLLLAARQASEHRQNGAYNFGPPRESCISMRELADLFTSFWDGLQWEAGTGNPDPSPLFQLQTDSSKTEKLLGWHTLWNASQAVQKTVQFTKDLLKGEPPRKCLCSQIADYLSACGEIQPQ